jgi:hypothetical protein
MEVGGEREEEETGRLVVVVFKAGWEREEMGRRGSGSGTSGSGRKTSASFAWSLQPGSAGPVSLARS